MKQRNIKHTKAKVKKGGVKKEAVSKKKDLKKLKEKAFSALSIKTKGFKFNRDEANER